MDAHYTRPKNWRKDIWELDPENLENNGLQNEDLMVWMRTAALPDFRKLYRKINHTGELETQLPDTKLKFTIKYREYFNKPFYGFFPCLEYANRMFIFYISSHFLSACLCLVNQ
jgi:hypothetical protein